LFIKASNDCAVDAEMNAQLDDATATEMGAAYRRALAEAPGAESFKVHNDDYGVFLLDRKNAAEAVKVFGRLSARRPSCPTNSARSGTPKWRLRRSSRLLPTYFRHWRYVAAGEATAHDYALNFRIDRDAGNHTSGVELQTRQEIAKTWSPEIWIKAGELQALDCPTPRSSSAADDR